MGGQSRSVAIYTGSPSVVISQHLRPRWTCQPRSQVLNVAPAALSTSDSGVEFTPVATTPPEL